MKLKRQKRINVETIANKSLTLPKPPIRLLFPQTQKKSFRNSHLFKLPSDCWIEWSAKCRKFYLNEIFKTSILKNYLIDWKSTENQPLTPSQRRNTRNQPITWLHRGEGVSIGSMNTSLIVPQHKDTILTSGNWHTYTVSHNIPCSFTYGRSIGAAHK